MQFKEIDINDKRIRGFLHEADSDHVVCILHGFMGNKSDHHFMLRTFGDEINQFGFNVFRFDFLGSGDSDGTFYDEVCIESQIEQCKHIVRQFQSESYKVHLFAFSLGGVIASHVAKEVDIVSLFLLSPAGNFNEIIFHMLQQFDCDNRLDINGFRINPRFIEESQKFSYFKDIGKFRGLIKIVQGTKDQYVSVKSLQNYKSVYETADIVLIDGADHCYSRVLYTDLVRKEIHSFYGKVKDMASKK